ncbi:DUF3810 domain-containing protein [Cyclobacterium jeungdonense]|uniref:DUF3810 domain-containing protein n=1 Tax=Cyclobacterium jeungdonense TaxID=708087 RepID=A0ABT8C680_9BACT|nr:DUF3810 domain-containing protein [Cyclobacterium jeungdonense]MDN3687831.1 DUF3810 domain-containing protein [Cyclobacterium jeungdonense]
MVFGKWIGGILGFLAILLRLISGAFPQFTESWYANGLFPLIRGMLDSTLGKLPFPAIYLFVGGLLLVLFYFGKELVIRIKGSRKRTFFIFRGLVNFCGWVVFLFLFLWGFNYYRLPLYKQLGLRSEPLVSEQLLEEMQLTEAELVALRLELHRDSLPLVFSRNFEALENQLREEMQQTLGKLKYSWYGSPSVKPFYPAGTLRRMGIFGIYFPFTGEGYLDPTLHPLEKTFTLAHELAHGFGITDEGEANFMGWMVCTRSGDSYLRYTGSLKLLRYQLNDLHRMDAEAYKHFVDQLPQGIRQDIQDIQQSNLEIRPYFLELSRRSNDFYLKSQGVKAGIRSYAQLPMLARAWRLKQVDLR